MQSMAECPRVFLSFHSFLDPSKNFLAVPMGKRLYVMNSENPPTRREKSIFPSGCLLLKNRQQSFKKVENGMLEESLLLVCTHSSFVTVSS